ncbi:hypothetical protein KI688_005713 [Linnemannia hyalina]|uniref:Uncharacterized protein n=1 Tax=Linnemannia hyalina TaxID=64524 RepID=A0A9P8BXR0_9FUNG|nr:hypothetical protein KI688_005713 [Linnemannia hyalina]
MISSSHIPRWLKPIAWFWGLLCLLVITASAQPISTCCMAYGTTNENTLYVVGGAHYTGISEVAFPAQFYALNLTQTGWNTSNPPWTMMSYPTSLLPRAMSRFQYSMALSPDNSTLGVWDVTDADRLVEYSVGNASWTSVNITDTLSGDGVQAVTDPTTGLVYFPGGGPANYSAMMVYNPTTGMITDAPSSYPIVNGHQRYYPATSVQKLPSIRKIWNGLFGLWGQIRCFKALNSITRIGVSAVPLVYNLANLTWTTTY